MSIFKEPRDFELRDSQKTSTFLHRNIDRVTKTLKRPFMHRVALFIAPCTNVRRGSDGSVLATRKKKSEKKVCIFFSFCRIVLCIGDTSKNTKTGKKPTSDGKMCNNPVTFSYSYTTHRVLYFTWTQCPIYQQIDASV